MADSVLTARAGEKVCLLGNEAIARGALEAGVRFVSGYPGTPASEIGDTFARIHEQADVQFEWSVNEKVALETAFGAAIMGARALCYMKHLGLAYAGDPLGTIPYVGVRAGMVIVSAGDPGMVVSPNEQDQRHLARMNRIPVLEPATPAEACAMTRFAFSLSEKTGLPVILRTTPRVAHARGFLDAGEISNGAADAPSFRRRPAQLTPVPVNARRMREKLDERFARAEALLAEAPFFTQSGSGPLGVLVAGAPASLVQDQVEERGLAERLTVLCAGATYPIPRPVLASFLEGVERVLVVEELTPFVEDELRALAHDVRPGLEVLGKHTGHLPARFGYGPDVVAEALASFAGSAGEAPATASDSGVLPRPPTLCPGCPHRGAYLAARTVFGDEGIYFNDIGCYTLGFGPPLETVDALLAMGSSIAMASSASRVLGKKTLAFIGDSTFFHSGMPALLNAAEAGDDVVVVVLDNRITGMTGHQPSPTTPRAGREGENGASIEAVARALGVPSVHTVDPNDLKSTVAALVETKRRPGTSLVVARRDCAIVRFREEGAAPVRRRFAVDAERCRHCGHESDDLFCRQGPVKEYERAMVIRRILDQEAGRDPTPSPVEREAPCSVACPVNICVQGYVGRIAGGRYAEALSLIRRRNPLPVVSSRVCHRPCEKVCIRADTDGPIAINDLKRFLVDREMAGGGDGDDGGEPTPSGPPSGKRVAVIGAGPSGLSCAHELRVRGHDVVLLDEHDRPGGLLVQAIPEHRLPREVLAYETDWILGHGVEFRGGVRLGRDVTLAELRAQEFDAVYLGVGAMVGLPVGVPGDDLPGNLDALRLLRRHHRGEPFEAKGKSFLVVGGGDAAIDAARTLVRLGGSSVRIVYRRSREEMPAHPEEVDAAEQEGVELLSHMAPRQVLGSDRVEGLRAIRTRPGPPDASGRRRPEPILGSETELAADHVVAAVGQRPDLSFLGVHPGDTGGGVSMAGSPEADRHASHITSDPAGPGGVAPPRSESGMPLPAHLAGSDDSSANDAANLRDGALALDGDGAVAVDPETGATSLPGVFAGGDLTPGPKTVVHAIADGRRAAYGIDLLLAEEGAVVPPVEFVNPEGLDYFAPRHLHAEPSHQAGLRPAGERRRDHRDVVVPLTEDEAREEAARCLLCAMCRSCSACTDLFGCPALYEQDGRIVIDDALCNGCGVCVAFCPNGAIGEVPAP